MKNILVLGGFGFIGSNILKYIDENLSEKFNVVVFDKFERHPRGLTFKCVKKVYAGDFSDSDFIERIFIENNINVVFHFLSSTVPATSNNARYDVESNLITTLNLLGIMDRFNVKDIVYLSSGGAIYGDHLQKVHNEEDAVYPKSSYGVIKLAVEKYLLSYAELYGFKTLILRLSNPYGCFHYNEKQGIINIAIRKALKGEPLEIWGSGDGIKDYIYIKDVCNIIFKLCEEQIETGVYNVASGQSLSVNDIVDNVQYIIPSFRTIHVAASIVDVQNFELDITKLRNKLGGYKMTQFEDAIREILKWEETSRQNC